MTSSSPAPTPARRKPVLVTLDVIASVLLLVIILGVALTVVTYAAAFTTATQQCAAGSVDGLECNSAVLGVVVFALYAVAIVGGFLALGMVVVNLIRRRYTFWWPLGCLVVIVAVFYVAAWLVGSIAPAA